VAAVKRAAPKVFTAWSYSRYRDFKKCPLFAKLKHLDKVPEPDSPAMARGTAIHKLAEDYLLGKLKKVPGDLRPLAGHFQAARKWPGLLCEEQWCFDKNWSPVYVPSKPFNLFNASEWAAFRSVWLRVKMDLHVRVQATEGSALIVVDHKTGKFREYEQASYAEQQEIYGMGGLLKYPDVDVVAPRMWYIDEGIQHGEDVLYPRADLPRLRKLWEQRVRPMFTETRFRPRQNDKCKWCPYGKEASGHCPF
jgi:hypothetical protein